MLVSTLLLHQIPEIKSMKEGREGGRKTKRRERDGERKVNFKEGTIILAQVPDDSVPSHLVFLLLGTGQEERTLLCCKFDEKNVLNLFFRKLKDKDPKSQTRIYFHLGLPQTFHQLPIMPYILNQ